MSALLKLLAPMVKDVGLYVLMGASLLYVYTDFKASQREIGRLEIAAVRSDLVNKYEIQIRTIQQEAEANRAELEAQYRADLENRQNENDLLRDELQSLAQNNPYAFSNSWVRNLADSMRRIEESSNTSTRIRPDSSNEAAAGPAEPSGGN